MRFLEGVLLLTVSFSNVAYVVAQTVAPTDTQPVHIRFGAVLDDKPFACGNKYVAHGLHDANVTPADMRFYISDIELLSAEGKSVPVVLDQDGLWQYRNIALVDLEDGSGGCRNGNAPMHREISGSVPSGKYTAVRFTVGLPFELGHVDPTASPAPLNFTAMSWVWQAGFKFIRAELLVENSSTPAAQAAIKPVSLDQMPMGPERMKGRATGFPIHLGSTGCVASSKTSAPTEECTHPNRTVVKIANFDAEQDTILFDLDRVLAGSELSKNETNSAPGCMSGQDDADCAPIFRTLGLPFGSSSAVEQTAFRKAAR